MKLLVMFIVVGLAAATAGCASNPLNNLGYQNNGGYVAPVQPYRPPAYTQMPSNRSSCGTGRNFC